MNSQQLEQLGHLNEAMSALCHARHLVAIAKHKLNKNHVLIGQAKEDLEAALQNLEWANKD